MMSRDIGKYIDIRIATVTLLVSIDRSAIPYKVTHRYIFLPTTPNHWIRGHGYGDPARITSFRSEHSGTLVVLTVLHVLIIQ